MDALIRVRPSAAGLLSRVDTALSRDGAAAGHAIWPLLRRIGLLPGDAVACAADWVPPVLTGRAAMMRRQHEAQANVSASLSGAAALSGWEGEAASAFQARLTAVRGELAAAEEESAALSACLDELADWLASARHGLARTLANALTSAEAVALTLGMSGTARIGVSEIGAGGIGAGMSGAAAGFRAAGGLGAAGAAGPRPGATGAVGSAGAIGASGGFGATVALGSSDAGDLSVRALHAEAAAAIGASVLAEVDRFWQGGWEIWLRHAARSASPARVSAHEEASASLRVDLG